MEAISFLTARPGRTKSGKMKSLTTSAVSRTRSRNKGCWRSRRGRTVGKPTAGSPPRDSWDRLFIGARRRIHSNTGKYTLLGVNSARRGNAGPGCERYPLRLQALFQRRQEQEDIVGAAAVTHQADAPGFALELAQTAADLDAEL